MLTIALTIVALPSAPTVAVPFPLAVSMSAPTFTAALERGQPLPQHGRSRHELPGAQPVSPLGRALPPLLAVLPRIVSAAAVRLAAALLGSVLAPAFAAAEPAVPGHGALAAVVQVMAELGREVARRLLEAAKILFKFDYSLLSNNFSHPFPFRECLLTLLE